ncbi:Gfo/Idh/MocA family protein [Cellulomonas hominis]
MSLGWGFVGNGGIAGTMAAALERSAGGRLVAVAARDAARGQAFADAHGGARVHSGPGAVARMLADPQVEAVYVATVHPQHHTAARAALLAGKPVLVEKPMTVSLAATRDLVDTARAQDVFLMEAYWTGLLPGTAAMLAVIASGAIGEVQAVRADLGFAVPADAQRFHDPALGGGSLLDLGPYPLGLALTLLGRPHELRAVGSLTATGVDRQVALSLGYADGAVASLATSMVGSSRSGAWVEGTRGSIEIDAPIFDMHRFTVRTTDGVENVQEHTVERGHHLMLDHVHECLARGRTESPVVGLQFSLDLAEQLEQVVEQIGITRAVEPLGATGPTTEGRR